MSPAALAVRAANGGDGARTVAEFKENRYDAATGRLVFTAAQAQAVAALERHYAAAFSRPDTGAGLRPSAITDPRALHDLTAFFAWSAWAAAAPRSP